MNGVKRYDHFFSGMYVDDMGQYVHYTDHVADKAVEVARLEQKVLDQDHELAAAYEQRDTLAERVRVLEEAIQTHKAKIEAGREDAMDIDFALWEVLVQPQQKEKGGKP